MPPAIRVENLGKYYRVNSGALRPGYRTLRESLVDLAVVPLRRQRHGDGQSEDFWALKDVSFQIQPGAVVGIIGRNGAGKSTLLKILSRITKPTTGRVELRGRVGSLLEVGTGFHPELTGRENVYLNGSILGMSRCEVARKFDEIVAFAEVEQFLDTPVKRYSSGMYVRLAFAVAAHFEPQILLVDEVLSVGDAAFQKRCVGRIRAISTQGRTILFVSHNMPAVQYLCSRCLLVDRGQIAQEGDPSAVISAYNRSLVGGQAVVGCLASHAGRSAGSVPSMKDIRLKTDNDPQGDVIYMNDNLDITVRFVAPTMMSDVTFGVVVKNHLQVPIFGVNNRFLPSEPLDRPIQRGRVTCRVERLPLTPGTYSLDLYLGTHGQNFDVVLDAVQFDVQPADVFGTGKLPPLCAGNVFWPATWRIRHDDDVRDTLDTSERP